MTPMNKTKNRSATELPTSQQSTIRPAVKMMVTQAIIDLRAHTSVSMKKTASTRQATREARVSKPCVLANASDSERE